MSQYGTPAELTATEQQVLDVLQEHGGPLDAIGIASRCRLEVETVLQALHTLTRLNLVSQAPPEPVHERFATAAHT